MAGARLTASAGETPQPPSAGRPATQAPGRITVAEYDLGDRARLINKHLQLLRDLSNGRGPLAGKLGVLAGHLDLSAVGTMGHSRGGKGVMWQASDKHAAEVPSGVNVRAVLALAPVKFDDPIGDNSDTLITRKPGGVVTSSCDGAVGEAGQKYLDDAAGKTHQPRCHLDHAKGATDPLSESRRC